MRIQRGFGPNEKGAVVSLCDYSGEWPRHFNARGHTIYQYDLKHGDDLLKIPITTILDTLERSHMRAFFILMAPPCTHFTISGAQYWPTKDADGRTAEAVALVERCLAITAAITPSGWCLENPVGRLPKLVPSLGKPRLYFNPCDYAGYCPTPEEQRANQYTKRTGLWGDFVIPGMRRLEPIKVCSQGSWLMKLGGKSERTKELRSVTPSGFARAFSLVNGGLPHTLA